MVKWQLPGLAFTVRLKYQLIIKYNNNMVNLKTSEIEIVRESTSFNIDKDLWKEMRKVAIDLEVSATDLVEEAIREKLAKIKKESKK